MTPHRAKTFVILLVALALACSPLLAHRLPRKPDQKKDVPAAPVDRLVIEVTGGDSNKPVENASVYLKTVEEGTIKDKKTEINVKTNQLGVAHIPQPPTGRVLIQIIAEGWKTYGRWHDITDVKAPIKIHLDRPPKWY